MSAVPQHLSALEKANRVRERRKHARALIEAGQASPVDYLADPDFASMPVLRLLSFQRRWGRQRSLQLLRRARINETTCGRLTERQRRVLAEELEWQTAGREAA